MATMGGNLNRQHFEHYEVVYIVLFWVSINLLETWINAESVIANYQRLEIEIASWRPYAWESTSHFSNLLLIPLIIHFNRKFPLNSKWVVRRLSIHLLFSFIYSLLHVTGMVTMRKIIYWSVGDTYDFGNWPLELVYEYRKDAYSYFWILCVIYAYRFISSRLKGEAKIISIGENENQTDKPERLLVKKIGKEFILRVEDIDYIEASGNYMNLCVENRIYPLRETMANLEKKLDDSKFVRIHRSSIVNLDSIKEIQSLESGDFDIILKGGKKLKLSRRYREKVKEILF